MNANITALTAMADRRFPCTLCRRGFDTRRRLAKHMKSYHHVSKDMVRYLSFVVVFFLFCVKVICTHHKINMSHKQKNSKGKICLTCVCMQPIPGLEQAEASTSRSSVLMRPKTWYFTTSDEERDLTRQHFIDECQVRRMCIADVMGFFL